MIGLHGVLATCDVVKRLAIRNKKKTVHIIAFWYNETCPIVYLYTRCITMSSITGESQLVFLEAGAIGQRWRNGRRMVVQRPRQEVCRSSPAPNWATWMITDFRPKRSAGRDGHNCNCAICRSRNASSTGTPQGWPASMCLGIALNQLGTSWYQFLAPRSSDF